MMKTIVCLLLFLYPFFVPAQIVVEQGMGFMFLQQRGFVFKEKKPQPIFPTKIEVGRYLAPFGGTIAIFIPFKIISPRLPTYKFGIQTGMGFYYTSRKKSLDLNYVPDPDADFLKRTFGIIHLPLLISFRRGSAFYAVRGRKGIAIAAGLDSFYLNIPDETGFALLPTTNFTFLKGRNGIRAGFYHLKFRSVFTSNSGEILRLKTSFFQLEVFHSF